DTGALLEHIDAPKKTVAKNYDQLPYMDGEREERSIVLLNGNSNHDYDIEHTLRTLKTKLARTSRVIIVAYNPYYRLLYRFANVLGFRSGEQPDTFVTHTDLHSIATLAGYDV